MIMTLCIVLYGTEVRITVDLSASPLTANPWSSSAATPVCRSHLKHPTIQMYIHGGYVMDLPPVLFRIFCKLSDAVTRLRKI